MSKELGDGGPAFPQNHSNFAQDGRCTSVDWVPGMSLRAYFASAQMRGLRAGNPRANAVPLAVLAVADADALIAELARDKPKGGGE